MNFTGEITISGDKSGSLIFNNLIFKMDQFENNNPIAEHESGTVTFASKDITEDIIDYIETELARLKSY